MSDGMTDMGDDHLSDANEMALQMELVQVKAERDRYLNALHSIEFSAEGTPAGCMAKDALEGDQ